MSLPKSKILSSGKSSKINVSKGVMALAKVKRDTNQCVNNQNVNITVQSTPQDEIVKYDTPKDDTQVTVEKNGVYSIVDRDAAEEVSTLATTSGIEICVNKALSLIIDLLESNPLIVNKYIVPLESTFIELIQALTLADTVEINYNDVDIDCCGLCTTAYTLVDKIYITKENETASLLYNYPDVIQLLDDHKISYQWILRDTT